MLIVSEISKSSDFYALRESWESLLVQSRANCVFLTWEWLYSWWQVYGREEKLHIVVVREHDELKAIAPFFQNSFHGLRCLRFIGSYGVGSDYLDFILYPGNEEQLLLAIFTYLGSRSSEWDLLYISDIPEHSMSVKVIQEQDAFYTLQKTHTVCPYLTLPSTWIELNSGFTQNMRYDLSRKQKRFEKELKNRFIAITEKKQMKAAWKNFLLLNTKRMKEKDISGPFTDKRFNEFHSRVIPLLFDKGMLRFFSLEVGLPIGYIYIIKYNNIYSFYQIGFDTDWNKLSPGTLLFRYSIEYAISEGAKEFDFLQGDEEYKFRWTKDVRRNVQLFVLSKSIKSRAIRLLLQIILKAKDSKRTMIHTVRKIHKFLQSRAKRPKQKKSP